MAFKMKGSPMQRNFGVGGSPMRDEKGSKTTTEPTDVDIASGKYLNPDPIERKVNQIIRNRQNSNMAYDKAEITQYVLDQQAKRNREIEAIENSPKVKKANQKILDARMKKYGTTDLEEINKIKRGK